MMGSSDEVDNIPVFEKTSGDNEELEPLNMIQAVVNEQVSTHSSGSNQNIVQISLVEAINSMEDEGLNEQEVQIEESKAVKQSVH